MIKMSNSVILFQIWDHFLLKKTVDKKQFPWIDMDQETSFIVRTTFLLFGNN